MGIKQKIYSVKTFIQKDIDAVERARHELFGDSERSELLLSQETDDTLIRIKNISERIKGEFQNLVIIGAGASINIPKMLWSFSSTKSLNIHFVERVDAVELNNIFKARDPKDTCVLAISKSGNTIEVNLLLAKFMQWFKQSLSTEALKTHVYVITEINSPLDKFARSINASSLPHPVNIGGRFSSFNTTGLLPAAIFGLKLEDFISAGKDSFNKLILEGSWVTEGALYNYSMSTQFKQSVLIKYNSVFDGALCWLRQIIAESLGKGEKGITPIVSDGIVDRHSQLQLYLDGPQDKFFTLFSSNTTNVTFDWESFSDTMTNLLIPSKVGLAGFKDINKKQENALLETLCKAKKNVRNVIIPSINEGVVAEFIMGQMLEVMLYAYLNNINPFGQPAIEKFKQELKIMEKEDE